MRAVAAVLVSIILAGCATAQLDSLTEVRELRTIEVNEPIRIIIGNSGVMSAGMESGLLAATYVAVKENQNGAFYVGPGRCVYWVPSKDRIHVTSGGIWIPWTAEHRMRLFAIVGAPTVVVSTVSEAAADCSATSKKVEPEKTNDLSQVLASNPQALGITPAYPPSGLSGSQIVGGAIGLTLAQSIADSAAGQYQLMQQVADAQALEKIRIARLKGKQPARTDIRQ